MIRIVLVDRNMASNELKRKSNTNSSGSAPKKAFGHWSMGLKASMEDPELRVDADDQIIIIKDKYPKVFIAGNESICANLLVNINIYCYRSLVTFNLTKDNVDVYVPHCWFVGFRLLV